jgi:tripartite-type tricarboxylate transporter receptor subunit TctC
MTRIVRMVPLMSLLAFGVSSAIAQECSGPIKMVVGLAAGGGLDIIARLFAQRIAARFNQPMIVENKVGAAANIAAEYVARAPADGCTLTIRDNSHNVNPLIYTRAGYETKDFAPVVELTTGSGVIVVGATQPFNTLAGMVEYAKANPGKLSYGSSGIGSGNHLFAEIFLRAAKIDVVHVPYKGAALAMADTAGGQVQLSLGSIASAQPYIDSGKVIAVAVTGPKRWPTLPNVPSFSEAGYPDATMVYWNGILAPTGTPPAVINKLNQEFRAVLEEAPVKERLLALGYEPAGGSPEDFARFLEQDERTIRKLVQELKLKVE